MLGAGPRVGVKLIRIVTIVHDGISYYRILYYSILSYMIVA